MEVLDVSIGTGSAERRADGFGVVGEDRTLRLSEKLGLRHDEGPGIEPGGGEERDPLVVAGLVARVLAVPDHEHPAVYVEIAPVGAADLVQPHRGSDGELHDARHGHRQARILVKAAEEAAEFSCRRASVALDTLADQTKPLQRHSGQIDAFNANLQPVDGSGMSQDHLDDADVDAGRYRPGALTCTLAAILDQLVTIEVPDLLFPEVALQRRECRRLGSRRGGFPTAHISAI